MDAKHLRNVIAVLEMGSLGRAASSLNVSQPALTKSIQRLEEQLGVPLFTRDSKGMRATIYGEALRPHAHGILASTAQAAREIETMRAGARGTVSIAAGPLVTSEILSTATINLMREHPLIHVKIHTAIGDQMQGLLTGRFDFILAQLPLGPGVTGTEQRALFNDRIAVVARPGHSLAKRSRVLLRDLLQAKWILPEAGHSHRARLARVFEAKNLSMPEPDIECSSTEFIKSVVSRSDHLGLIAQMGINKASETKVVEIAIDSPFMGRPIGIVWRQNQVLSSSSRLLMASIELAHRRDVLNSHANSSAKSRGKVR